MSIEGLTRFESLDDDAILGLRAILEGGESFTSAELGDAYAELSRVAPELAEISFDKIMQSVGKVASRAAPGAIQGAAVGGPFGAVAGGLMSMLGGQQPSRAPRARKSAPASSGSAGTQLLGLLQSPGLLQAVGAGAAGALGRRSVPVGGQPVPVSSVLDLLSSLAGRAASEAEQLRAIEAAEAGGGCADGLFELARSAERRDPLEWLLESRLAGSGA